MRILLDTHMVGARQTGIGRYWSNLSRSLSDLPDMELFYYGGKKDAKKVQERIFIPQWDNGIYRVMCGFRSAIRRYHPDLLHVSNFAPLASSVPVITTVHDMCYLSAANGFSLSSRLAFFALLKRSLMMSQAVVSVSGETKKIITGAFGISPEKIHVIHEAADPIFFNKQNMVQTRRYLANTHRITGDFFLVVGTIEKRKRPDDIVEAFRQVVLQNRARPIQLVFVGPNRLGNDFIHRHQDLIDSDRVRILGYVPDYDMPRLYRASRALVYFSRCEGFGLPLVEAMASHTPILCTDSPLFHEIVRDAGIYCRSPIHLARAMAPLIGPSFQYHRYQARSRMRSRHFSWQSSADKLCRLYHSITS